MNVRRIAPGAPPTRRDLEFSIYESVLLPLPAATRKAVVIGPPGNTYQITVHFSDAAADIATGATGLLRDGGGVTVAGAGSTTHEFWPTDTTSQRREIIDGRAYLQLSPQPRLLDPSNPPKPAAGDYQLFGYPSGWVEKPMPANNAYVPLAYGRLRLLARPHYFDDIDIIDDRIARLRDALTHADSAPSSAALMEVETPDGNRERYAGVRTLEAALNALQNRRAYLLATHGGRAPLAGFQLTT